MSDQPDKRQQVLQAIWRPDAYANLPVVTVLPALTPTTSLTRYVEVVLIGNTRMLSASSRDGVRFTHSYTTQHNERVSGFVQLGLVCLPLISCKLGDTGETSTKAMNFSILQGVRRYWHAGWQVVSGQPWPATVGGSCVDITRGQWPVLHSFTISPNLRGLSGDGDLSTEAIWTVVSKSAGQSAVFGWRLRRFNLQTIKLGPSGCPPERWDTRDVRESEEKAQLKLGGSKKLKTLADTSGRPGHEGELLNCTELRRT
ncbi:hypothetical protein RRG08_020677 [Elysia crispata]|uniref:Uncharacterized protein n=1 Tax=Elysia crispata TaxID=231223 RepID=A0AAE1DAR4_9GAST|nr:hypothetical protein RRG08_020677 [Elysia crispata]